MDFTHIRLDGCFKMSDTVLAAPLQNMEVADNIIHLFTCFRLMEKVIGAAEKNDAVTKLAE